LNLYHENAREKAAQHREPENPPIITHIALLEYDLQKNENRQKSPKKGGAKHHETEKTESKKGGKKD